MVKTMLKGRTPGNFTPRTIQETQRSQRLCGEAVPFVEGADIRQLHRGELSKKLSVLSVSAVKRCPLLRGRTPGNCTAACPAEGQGDAQI